MEQLSAQTLPSSEQAKSIVSAEKASPRKRLTISVTRPKPYKIEYLWRIWIPKRLLVDIEDERKATLLVQSFEVFFVVFTVRLVAALIVDQTALTVDFFYSVVTMTYCFALALLLRITSLLDFVSLLFIICFDLTLFAVLVLNGTSVDEWLYAYLVLVPLFAVFLLGVIPGCIALLVIIIEGAMLILINTYIPAGLLPMTNDTPVSVAIMRGIVIAGIGLIAVAYERHRLFLYDQLVESVTQRERMANEIARATEAKSRFLANIAHELRTPLHGIVGMVNELAESTVFTTEGAATPFEREALHNIQDCAEHMLNLINDILDYEKLEVGKMTLESIPMSLRREVVKVHNVITTAATKKGVRLLPIQFEVEQDVHLGDPLRFRQILLNLLSNAVKFTSAGGTVSISVRNVHAEGIQKVSVEVTDTGVGIDPEQLPNMFMDFSQLDVSTSRRFGGSGLGLSISRRLVEMMGGKIGVRSELGKGSTFWFYVHMSVAASDEAALIEHEPTEPSRVEIAGERQAPLPPLQSTAREETVAVSRRDSVQEQDMHGKHVLVVDDNSVNQRVTCRLLSQLGIRTTSAMHGGEAVQAYSQARGQFDLILMDCQMPVMDGFTATQRIRALEQSMPGRHTTIVGLTADPQIRTLCEEAGMDDFLVKPFTKEQLYAKVSKWFAHNTIGQP